ncbi:Rieske (2Fe-2S) protein [Nonomuraea muscovyensis]|uniref:Cytochrome bc1 complex Rieske iron-sulfur subunit n=1 Tax=Nonomuraea muscovyensis TaxID=1124761 RepID=A0A7X0C4R7_9ACTN|nr:Rieske (2Fe-2S) protein [Nonomuraea muscovyensis]MBB6348504.1 nitrite reductase/ring-hydroxylating ferredoxin subunit [Nonomuraea muscovyensis]
MNDSERGSAMPGNRPQDAGACGRASGQELGRESGQRFGRREALGAAGIAACGLALAGCGSGGQDASRVPGIKGKVIARTADVPVGGGKVVDQWKIVVTQPSEGVYKAFSAICPHRGCAVGSPENDVMTCPCHGSEFAADTGKCLKGPASGPLTPYQVKVEGDGIVVV